MKEEFIEKLICPTCKNDTISILRVDRRNHIEICEGTLRCQSCSKEYSIRDGILNYLLNHEMQNQYDPDGKKRLNHALTNNPTRVLSKKEIAYREDLYPKWVKSSTANFDQIFNWLSLSGNENILEFGAGTCWAIQRFAKYGCKCVALDILSYHKLDMANHWFAEKGVYFERILADMNQSNFRENSFDLVYSLSSMMYSSSIPNTLHEINRILKLGGKLVLISEPIIPFYQANDYKRHGSGSACTTFEWDHYIKNNGFKIVKRFFAESIKIRFQNPELITQRDRWYCLVVKLLSPLWRTKFFKGTDLDKFSWLYSVFMPLPLTIVAIKEK